MTAVIRNLVALIVIIKPSRIRIWIIFFRLGPIQDRVIRFWMSHWIVWVNFFLKSKRYRFNKKIKVNRLQPGFWSGQQGRYVTPVFFFSICFSTWPDSSSELAGPGSTRQVELDFKIMIWILDVQWEGQNIKILSIFSNTFTYKYIKIIF